METPLQFKLIQWAEPGPTKPHHSLLLKPLPTTTFQHQLFKLDIIILLWVVLYIELGFHYFKAYYSIFLHFEEADFNGAKWWIKRKLTGWQWPVLLGPTEKPLLSVPGASSYIGVTSIPLWFTIVHYEADWPWTNVQKSVLKICFQSTHLCSCSFKSTAFYQKDEKAYILVLCSYVMLDLYQVPLLGHCGPL